MKKLKRPLVIIPAALLLVLLLLFYGPISAFRVMWIQTAMSSASYKWLAQSLYTPSYIAAVQEENRISSMGYSDPSLVSVSRSEGAEFIPIKGSHFEGYIIKIADPLRVQLKLASDPHGELIESLTSGYLGGINASGYGDIIDRGVVDGVEVLGGEVKSDCKIHIETHSLAGMTESGMLMLGEFPIDEWREQPFLWAVEFGPTLIVNGEKTRLTGFSGGIQPRSAIGQTAKGEILLLVIDGRRVSSLGATYLDVQTALAEQGAINAMLLDGGSSSSMAWEGKLVNQPSDSDSERLLPNAIVVAPTQIRP